MTSYAGQPAEQRVQYTGKKKGRGKTMAEKPVKNEKGSKFASDKGAKNYPKPPVKKG